MDFQFFYHIISGWRMLMDGLLCDVIWFNFSFLYTKFMCIDYFSSIVYSKVLENAPLILTLAPCNILNFKKC